MLQDGVGSAEDIDRAMELGYRHPMGPLRLTDLVGLDVRLAIAEYLHRELGGERFLPPQILRDKVEAGKLGRKSGEGWPKASLSRSLRFTRCTASKMVQQGRGGPDAPRPGSSNRSVAPTHGG